MNCMCIVMIAVALAAFGGETPVELPTAWEMSAPLIAPVERPTDPYVSVKDPTFAFHEGRWHIFMTIRPHGHTPTEYASFETWKKANAAPRTVLALRDKYFCAPQIFYFRPHKKWYLVYQVGEPTRRVKHQPAFSTTANIADPTSWTKSKLFFPKEDPPSRKVAGLDYWIICDAEKAYLFYTSLNGRMWRMWTWLKDFPYGLDHCELALRADIFEASHIYRLKGTDKYLNVIEAGQSGRRYFKAYVADRLDGAWSPLADTQGKPFAGAANVRPAPGVTLWADNISHGELIRDSYDERMIVDPANLRFIFQGVLQKNKPRQYGLIPWRIGMLTPARQD